MRVSTLDCDNSPRISVPVEESGAEEEVEVGRKGADLRLHLASIPDSRTLLVIFVPGIEHLVGILSDEGVRFHQQADLKWV